MPDRHYRYLMFIKGVFLLNNPEVMKRNDRWSLLWDTVNWITVKVTFHKLAFKKCQKWQKLTSGLTLKITGTVYTEIRRNLHYNTLSNMRDWESQFGQAFSGPSRPWYAYLKSIFEILFIYISSLLLEVLSTIKTSNRVALMKRLSKLFYHSGKWQFTLW